MSVMQCVVRWAAGVWLAVTMVSALAALQPPAQAQATNQSPAAPTRKPDEGIPVTDQTVIKACGSCHKADEKQQLTRISFQRNTPEGWQTTIQRMAALNNLQIDPKTARDVVKYLANNHGLAPEEARAGAFEVERRLIDYKYTASSDTE